MQTFAVFAFLRKALSPGGAWQPAVIAGGVCVTRAVDGALEVSGAEEAVLRYLQRFMRHGTEITVRRDRQGLCVESLSTPGGRVVRPGRGMRLPLRRLVHSYAAERRRRA